jgi:hypothetical protein
MDRIGKTTVWYREPWPWIAMSGPALAVIGCVISIYLAVRGADPVVDEDYYQHGLQINQRLQREQQVKDLRRQTEGQVESVRPAPQ